MSDEMLSKRYRKKMSEIYPLLTLVGGQCLAKHVGAMSDYSFCKVFIKIHLIMLYAPPTLAEKPSLVPVPEGL
jgi:hypothetical protein